MRARTLATLLLAIAIPAAMPGQVFPAQQPTQIRRGFIGIGIGPSAPVGGFAEATSANPRGGSATPGYINTFLNIGYRIRRHWGVAAALSYGEYVMRDGGEDDWWQIAGFTVGPMYTHTMNAKAALDLKALVGWLAATPVIDSYSTRDGVGGGFAAELRAALRYDVFTRWAVFAEAGVQSSSVSYVSGRKTDVGNVISGLGIAYRPRW